MKIRMTKNMKKNLNCFVLLATNLNLSYRFGKLGTCFL